MSFRDLSPLRWAGACGPHGAGRRRACRAASAVVLAALLAAPLSGCSTAAVAGSGSAGSSLSASAATGSGAAASLVHAAAQALDASDMFSDRDQDATYDAATSTRVELSGSNATVSGNGVTVADGVLTVSAEGTYVLTGDFAGQVVVDADGANVHLVLAGANVQAQGTAALYVKAAKNVVVTLAEGTDNALSTSGSFTDDDGVDSAVFSRDDLSFNGSGALAVSCEAGHGIVGKDDLAICGGTITVTAVKKGISANDSIRMNAGTVTVDAGTDALHAENTDDAQKGFVYIAGGTLDLAAAGDGISASSTLQVDGGEVTVQTSGEAVDADTGAQASSKGLKAAGDLVILGGTVSVASADDALHANGNVGIAAGTLTLSSGDDGVHADGDTTIEGGTVAIPSCYEGVEGTTVNVYGGEVSVASSDDGLNAAGGSDNDTAAGPMGPDSFAAQSDATILIAGGSVTVTADGDGVDSNGSITVTGGTLLVAGPENDGNSALDYDGTATISGGTVIACGMSGMAQGFGESSSQAHALVSMGSVTSDDVVLTDASGAELTRFSPGRSYNCVVVSCADMASDGTYAVNGVSFTLSGTSYSDVAGGMAGMPGAAGAAGVPGDPAAVPAGDPAGGTAA